MNALTTGWNDSSLYLQHVFQDKITSVQITVPANRPFDVRAFIDAVAAGSYTQVSP